VRGEDDRELTFEVGDGATASGTVTGVRDDDGGTAVGIEAEVGVSNGVGVMVWHRGRRQRHRGRRRRWRSIEGGGVGDGDGCQG
jgi:hypothetical protein